MTNKSKQRGSKNGKVEFRGFFNPVLNKDIKVAVKSLDMDAEAVLERHRDILFSGYKVSVVCDKAETHFTASIFDRRPDSKSAGYVLSVKHSRLEVALTLLWFLINEIYEGKGWPVDVRGDEELDW